MTDDELTKAEALTVRRMAEVSGIPTARIMHYVDSVQFAAAVSLATGKWDYYDAATDTWRRDRAKQERQFRNCTTALLVRESRALQ